MRKRKNCVKKKSNIAGTQSVILPGDISEIDQRDTSQSIGLTAKREAASIIEIKEKMFIAQTNDVYLNPEEYLGKTIKLEGLFKLERYAGNDPAYCFVLRYGPGCCGNDGNAGFEVAWDKWALEDNLYPNTDDWVEAIGVLKTYEEDGYPYLYIALSELTVLDKKGAEYVTQ
jgi:uncharacterized membrane protein YcgQ (UPF0703/DUF1980 family)